jgi:hypothetical protein
MTEIQENLMLLEVSIGEAIDKMSILEIKYKEIKDEDRRKNVQNEITMLRKRLDVFITSYKYYYDCLYKINKKIWDLTDQVKEVETNKEIRYQLFEEIFNLNEQRFRVKSKLNTITSSSIKEQKSYSTSVKNIAPLKSVSEYKQYEGYIRYLSLLYDIILINCDVIIIDLVKQIFQDDPHIKLQSFNDNTGDNLNNINPDDYKQYSYSTKTINYICGGRLGDLLHLLYVIKVKYEKEDVKGNLYITNDIKWGGDYFNFEIERTYKELCPILESQSYIEKFSILSSADPDIKIDVNLNIFRKNKNLHNMHWYVLLSDTFNIPLSSTPWVRFNKISDRFKNKIVVHRSAENNPDRFTNRMLNILETIIDKNDCVFVSCDKGIYEKFLFKHKIKLELVDTLEEMYTAINSAKLFIGNQSSPLVIAMSMGTPCLAEVPAGAFYINSHYYCKDFYWVSATDDYVVGLDKFVNY